MSEAPESGVVDLSVIVVSHNHRRVLERYLPSLEAALEGFRFEALLVDNTGQERLAALATERWPWLTTVTNDARASFAENVNMALRKLQRGRYVVLWNPDVQARPGLFQTLVSFMDLHPDVGIAGPRLLNADGSFQPSARAFSTPALVLARGLRLDRVFPGLPAFRRYLSTDLPSDRPSDVDWITGALTIVRREALVIVGGMDERYRPAYSEDQDWCCRMWRSGWGVMFVPEAEAVHDHQRAGIRRPWSRMGRAQVVNAVRMFFKYRGRLSRAPRGSR